MSDILSLLTCLFGSMVLSMAYPRTVATGEYGSSHSFYRWSSHHHFCGKMGDCIQIFDLLPRWMAQGIGIPSPDVANNIVLHSLERLLHLITPIYIFLFSMHYVDIYLVEV